ncbi:MAG: DNA primase [Candidatus Magasanikbacteria bacterium RIFCSPLOWO2_12_FULL_47_9b]|nr:MAG: DNA primase [Candidatus Magasanikbacteria bacterium RIFCSPLOWO2_12_FULL_47_9b]
MTDVEQIKDKLDIADIVGEYVELKPAGVNQKGLCPFHHEKSPSFMVNRERQSFKCFGCGKGGDLFTFIQEIEGMEFVEALKYLANRAGVTLTNTRADINSSQKNRMKDINAEAARFFHKFLVQMDASRPAREYLASRGMKDETIEAWQVGFIPYQWDLLTQYLLKKGHGIDDLIAAGLTIRRDGADVQTGRGLYDRFRGRIMFPISDVHGTVVGFTGRVLVETERSGGKYVNSPQTLVYDKSRVVFGLDKAKQDIKTKNEMVMVEGQMDVIACHEAGMKNVVATSGTALTEHQLTLLKRYAFNMAMAFDTDAAGENAAKRGIDLAIAEGFSVRVIQIPDGAGKDPDECVKKNSSVWFDAVEHARGIMEWLLERAFAGKNLSDPKQKQQIVNMLLPKIMAIPYAVERDHWMKIVANRIGVDVPVLLEDTKRLQRQKKAEKPGEERKRDSAPVEKTRFDRLAESYLALILRFPDAISASVFEGSDIFLSTDPYFSLYEAIKNQYTEKGSVDREALRFFFLNGTENSVDVFLMKGDLEFSDITKEEAPRRMEEYQRFLEEESKKRRREFLAQHIRVAEEKGNKEELERLLQEFQHI